MSYKHAEAFALMWYACPCGHRERIWNSRDGVTPFGGVFCPSCAAKGPERHGLTHIEWKLDECRPDHKLVDGQRFFRNGTAEDAIRIIERRLAMIGLQRAIPAEIAEKLRQDARNQTGEWHDGWPIVDRYMAPQS